MKQTFTIHEISDLLGIPKSTLRYWDQEGLLTPARNDNNRYREYSLTCFYELLEIMLYRDLHMPMKELKMLYHITPSELSHVLEEHEKKLNDEIHRLEQSRQAILQKKAHIQKYKEVQKNPYQPAKPDIKALYPFDISNKEYWCNYYSDSYYFSLFIDTTTGETTHACLQPEFSSSDSPMWEYQDCNYVECILQYDFSNYENNNVDLHLNHLHAMGYKTGNIIARNLFAASDEKGRKDYFLGWIEIKQ
ncbi:transcriptional regulator, MerR family [Lachnospiraceae bacterium KM106-2]|nr:transcriptional regulator, MerR family [Lachnospiraceae bacterium KM106-2]